MSGTSEDTDTMLHEHPGDEVYQDRRRMATTEGVMNIDMVTVEEIVNNGETKETVKTFWRANCPVCGVAHEQGPVSEESAREEAWRSALNCGTLERCGAEWVKPEDYIEDCDICGDDHRERDGCTVLFLREPFPGPDSHRYSCSDCGWEGEGDDFDNHRGYCPECESAAVRAIEVED